MEALEPVAPDNPPEFLPVVDMEARGFPAEAPASTELKVSEKDFIKHAMEKRPEAVLPHVVTAAEQNKPLEAVYERRHEVKDQDVHSPMVPISQVVAEFPKRQPTLTELERMVAGLSPSPSPSIPLSGRFQKLSLYQRAIVLGLAGGVVVLVIVLISNLLR